MPNASVAASASSLRWLSFLPGVAALGAFTAGSAWAAEHRSAGQVTSLAANLATSLRSSLESGQLWWAIVACWVGGFLTALTPCVYPLIPVIIRYFGGMKKAGTARVVGLAVVYVLGIVILYAILGSLFASTNRVLGSFLANPWVVLGIAAFCVAMGVSMLGGFTLQLPTSLNTRLSQLGGQTIGGAFIMGLVSSLIAAPCTGPVTGVILAFIATTGDTLLGFLLMTAFALGLGLPFMVLAIFSNSLSRLPAGGIWMEIVKALLATAMFVVAIYFVQLFWPEITVWLNRVPAAGFAVLMLIALGALAVGFQLYSHERRSFAVEKISRVLGVLLLTAGVSLALLGDTPPPAGAANVPPIAWETSHEMSLVRARAEKKPVMIDFTADWCLACKDLDRHTYIDPNVRTEARRFINLKLDATEIDKPTQELFERYSVLGLPTVVFVDSTGKILDEPRVTGFVEPERFLTLMAQVR